MNHSQPSRSTQHSLEYKIFNLIVEEGFGVESHLPESFFAERLKVSRTPIRAGLQALAAQGVIERRPYKGYFVITPPEECSLFQQQRALPQEVEGIPTLCYTIGADYLAGNIGRRFSETELTKRYAVNRGNIQQATTSMESEGWIHRLLGYGWEFNEFLTSQDTYDQCYRYRIMIEPSSLLEPGYHINPETLNQLKQVQIDILNRHYEHASPAQLYTICTHLHETLVAGSHNTFLIEGLKRANRLRRLIELNVYKYRESIDTECQEHIKLLDLISSGNTHKASCFLKQHLERARTDKLRISKPLMP